MWLVILAAIQRERDELLALLDVQERQRYEATKSHPSQDDQAYNNFTSAEVKWTLLHAIRSLQFTNL